ncbi:MAG: 3-deoxy-manno-octulosonate cytidylyltransferase [Acetobacteraceae bacterium]
MKAVIIIPSRLAASRLPDKPLAMIGAKPMVVHVAEAARAANVGPVIVAAGDREIMEAVAGCGVHAVLTDPALPSGTDRVHVALQEFDPDGALDTVINLQGDLPLIRPEDIAKVLAPLNGMDFDIGALVAPIMSEAEANTHAVVKVACAFGRAGDIARGLYFSRHVIPSGAGPLWHHVGIYAWRRPALNRFVTLPPSALEKRESLEQLRALENGMTIGCAQIATAPQSVDTADDLEIVRRHVAKP